MPPPLPPTPGFRPAGTVGDYNRGPDREGAPLPDGVDPYSLLNVQIADEPNPPMVQPGIQIATPGEGILIDVEVKDRLLMELKRRLFPSDVEGILYSAITGDVYWMDQLFQLMIDTWPRLQTNIGKLKRAVSSVDYTWNPYKEDDKEATPSAIEKAQLCKRAFNGMSSNMAFQERDFKETLEDIVEAIPSGFVISEVYWETRNKDICPRTTRRIPARYYRYPYVIEATDRLMLNPSGTLGGTDLYDFPPYKFLVCIKHSSVHHPCFSVMMRCLAAWWVASRFGLEWFMNYAQLFGIPYRKATYEGNDQLVYQRLVSMMRQAGSASWGIFPSGTEVEILTAAGATGNMPQERLLEYADKICDILLLGQTLTTEVGASGSRALGGVHKEVLDEITLAAALWSAKVINTQVVPGIIRFNYGDSDNLELPTLDPVIKSPVDLLQTAQALQIIVGRGQGQLGIKVKKSELYERIEFSEPEDDDDVYEPPDAGTQGGGGGELTNVNQQNGNGNGNTPAPTTQPGFDENRGTQPGRMANPKGTQPPQSPPRNVRATRDEHTITFTADYGLESAPGEILRFVQSKIGFDTDVEIVKRNVDAGDDHVCAACKDITEEGWISADDIFRGFTANAPHHPNCRCKTEYKAGKSGVYIHHESTGNPYHHPETGKFVEHPSRKKVTAGFDPNEARDPIGRWTSGKGESEDVKAKGKEKKKTPDFSKIKDPDFRGMAEETWKHIQEMEEGEGKKNAEKSWHESVGEHLRHVKGKEIAAKVQEVDKSYAELHDPEETHDAVDSLKEYYKHDLMIDPDAQDDPITARKIYALSDIPEALHERLTGHLVRDIEVPRLRIAVGNRSVSSYIPELANEQPRGWSEGDTFKMVSGCYSPSRNLAVLGGKAEGAKSTDNEDLAFHEMGHAVAQSYGQETMPQAEKAWDDWNAGLDDFLRKNIYDYYTQQDTKRANISEALAESFKDYHKYGADVCTYRWGQGFTDIHADAVNLAKQESKQLKKYK